MSKIKIKEIIIDIEGSALEYRHVAQCVDIYKELLNDKFDRIIYIINAKDAIHEFDYSLIGHLILFKDQIPNIDICIKLNKNILNRGSSANVEENSMIWKLKQSMVHAYFSLGCNVFKIVDGSGNEYSAEYHKEDWFVLSKKILPYIYVNNKQYENIFISNIDSSLFKEILGLYDIINNDEQYFHVFRRYIFNLREADYIKKLSTLAFIGALKEAKILVKYFDDKERYINNGNRVGDDERIGHIRNEDIIEDYKKVVYPVFHEMIQKPPIYSMVYYVLISSELLPSIVKNDNVNEFKKIIVNLWNFTCELVGGIDELAKNIIQHATTKAGVIGGYISTSIENDIETHFRLSVFDHSNKGVVDTLRESIQKTVNELKDANPLREIFKGDLAKIEDSAYKYSYLFESPENCVLYHQMKRATAHLGLLIFSKLIDNNKGGFFSYTNTHDKIECFSKRDNICNSLSVGTGYDIILPIKTKGGRHDLKGFIAGRKHSVEDKKSIQSLFDFNEVIISDKTIKEKRKNGSKYFINIIIDTVTNFRGSDIDDVWQKHMHRFTKYSKKENLKMDGDIIVCFDLSSVSVVDSSDLFRVLGWWELEYPKIDLVVFGISVYIYRKLYEINKLYIEYLPGMSFWNDKSVTLFYSYHKLKSGGLFYFADALWGRSEVDYLYINTLIAKNNYNVTQCFDFVESPDFRGIKAIDSTILYKDSALLPLDLLIKDKKNISLFEINTLALLGNELDGRKSSSDNADNIDALIKGLPGYKISSSHFRLGSKIHISDFYYAKRLFQNSFFSSRFAYIIANYINDKYLKEKSDGSIIEKLTIIGYGIYSELLLSTIESYIKELSGIEINHNIYDDAEDLRLLKGYTRTKDNVVIVVPIATTLSTSMKIAEKIRSEDKRVKVLEYINTIIVTNGDISKRKNVVVGDTEIEYRFGWRKILNNTRAIKIIPYYGDKVIRNQRYLLALESKWYSIYECEICYPSKIKKDCINKVCDECLDRKVKDVCPLYEKPLHTADKTPENPELIFNYPKGKTSREKESCKYIITDDSLGYGHIIRNNNHFQYHIYDDVFYDENRDGIEKWLHDIVRTKIYDNADPSRCVTDNVIIVAPKHYSNTLFVNAVNNLVFGTTANILHYDFQKHNIENFILFYGDTIRKADKVIFVDDALITGETFKTASLYVKHVRDISMCFDTAIFLINRSNSYVYDVLSELVRHKNGLFSFANMNLPSLRDDNTECKLCRDKKKYEEIRRSSILIRFNEYYEKKIIRLSLLDLSKTENELRRHNKEYDDTQKNIIKIEVIHRLYEYFNKYNIPYEFEQKSFYEWKKHFIKNTVSPYVKSMLKDCDSDDNCLSDVSAIILKVMALSPFNKYMLIKNRLFVWINELLNEYVENIKNTTNISPSYEQFRSLKYLIRRASVVGSNYLISERFLRFICHIYNVGWIDNIESDYRSKKDYDPLFKDIQQRRKEEINYGIDNFMVYVVAQIKELIYENEARSIVLEKRVLQLSDEYQNNILPTKFLRLLREENGVLLNTIIEKMNIQKNNKLKEAFEGFVESDNYQYLTLIEYFRSAKPGDIGIENSINSFLSILALIDSVNDRSDLLLSDKVLSIGNEIKRNIAHNEYNATCGEFIIIKLNQENINDKLENVMIAYNSGYAAEYIDERWIRSYNYIAEFIDGVFDEGKNMLTIDLLRYDIEDSSWISMYTVNKKPIQLNYIVDCSYVLILKLYLAGDEYGGNNSMGVIVLYSKENIFNINVVRYLLLLRGHISKFVYKYYKNYEFAEWNKNNNVLNNILAYSHSSDVYEQIFKDVTDNLDEYNSNLIRLVGLLIMNQQKAYKFIQDYEKSNGNLSQSLVSSDMSEVRLSIAVIKDKINAMISAVFKFKHPRYQEINDYQYNINLTEEIDFIEVYPGFFFGVLFELIYNIRKQYVFYVGKIINENNKIIINIDLSHKELVVSNNMARLILTDEKVGLISDNMKYHGVRKGLNIIYYISEILYGHGCESELIGDLFKIKIPLREKNENCNH
jgi:hypothetical protein